jgi:sRNA-binding protein
MTERDGGNGHGAAEPGVGEERATLAERTELEHEREADLAAEERREQETAQRRAPQIAEIPTGVVSVKPFPPERISEFRTRWSRVQELFVEDPRRSLEQAGANVQDVIRELGASFARERSDLERRMAGGDSVSTEELRVALRRYKSFFDRILTL